MQDKTTPFDRLIAEAAACCWVEEWPRPERCLKPWLCNEAQTRQGKCRR